MWAQSLSQKDRLDGEMATAPVFLLEKSHGQRSLVGYSPMGHKELDMTKHKHTPRKAKPNLPCSTVGSHQLAV